MKKFKGFSNLHLGHENSKSGREFISYIADAVKERVAAFLASSDFMSKLTDGPQVRKTGINKEMVLICTKSDGEFFVHCCIRIKQKREK